MYCFQQAKLPNNIIYFNYVDESEASKWPLKANFASQVLFTVTVDEQLIHRRLTHPLNKDVRKSEHTRSINQQKN